MIVPLKFNNNSHLWLKNLLVSMSLREYRCLLVTAQLSPVIHLLLEANQAMSAFPAINSDLLPIYEFSVLCARGHKDGRERSSRNEIGKKV